MLRAPDTASLDDSDAWLSALRGSAAAREHALAGLHALLLRAARFELDRRSVPSSEREDLAQQAADDAIQTVLTPRQREVFCALALNGVPIDVLAQRLNTTRGALYKTLHDARRKLRTALEGAGYSIDADLVGRST